MDDRTDPQGVLAQLDEIKDLLKTVKNRLDRLDGRLEGVETTVYAIHDSMDI